MLTGITTRTSTPQEDAEPWPGGSAEPVLDYLTGTLGMTDADARELLKAARTAQAETGPGTLADYPVPGRDAHLLIHYAPGSRAYRFKLTAPGKTEAPPGTPTPANRPRAPGNDAARRDAGLAPAPERPAPPGPAKITVTIWHNVAFDGQGRHTAMLDGYQPGDPVVAVFAYQADPAAAGGRHRRRGVRYLQRPPQGRRRSRAGPRLLRAQAAVAVVPRKDTVLPEVMLRPPQSHVVGMAVDWLPGYGQQGHGWASRSSWCRNEPGHASWRRVRLAGRCRSRRPG